MGSDGNQEKPLLRDGRDTDLKQLAQAHYGTLRHKARAEEILVDQWSWDWRQSLGLLPKVPTTFESWQKLLLLLLFQRQ